jgi:hypothetical protein
MTLFGNTGTFHLMFEHLCKLYEKRITYCSIVLKYHENAFSFTKWFCYVSLDFLKKKIKDVIIIDEPCKLQPAAVHRRPWDT